MAVWGRWGGSTLKWVKWGDAERRGVAILKWVKRDLVLRILGGDYAFLVRALCSCRVRLPFRGPRAAGSALASPPVGPS